MSTGLLEPRLYRAAFIPSVLAVIVLAFSLENPPRSLTPELAPPTFSAQRVKQTAAQLVRVYGARESGGADDRDAADFVRARLEASGLVTSAYRFRARTLRGRKTLTNVVGVRAGPSDRRLVVIASRDGSRGPLERVGAFETGVLLELARVLEGRSFDHTIVFASVSGGVDGGLGSAELAQRLRRPVDAVVVVRNLAVTGRSHGVLAQFDSRLVPDPGLVRTLQRIVSIELGGSAGRPSTGAQLVRAGFPLALGEQATFPDQGLAGASLSPGGEPLTTGVASDRIVAGVGRAALRALTTFDDARQPARPQPSRLELGGKLIPAWSLILFIGTLLIPLVVVAVDGWARARRRRETATRGLVATAIGFAWLMVSAVLLRLLGAVGALDAPPVVPDPGALTGVLPVVVAALFLLLSPTGLMVAAGVARRFTPKGGESGFALALAFAMIAVFAVNPVAALFWLPLAHLLTLLLLAGERPRPARVWTLAIVGLLPPAVAVAYYPLTFDAGLLESLRLAVLLRAGGYVGVVETIGGCLIVAAVFLALVHLHWTAASRPARPSYRPPLLD